jgi:hypothetical protein
MITHSQMWKALDWVADQYALPIETLAEKACIDPIRVTTRVTTEGRARWPTCKDVAALLQAAQITPLEFYKILERQE